MLLNKINKIEIRSLAPWEMKIIFLNSLYSEIKFLSKLKIFDEKFLQTFSKNTPFKYLKINFTGR